MAAAAAAPGLRRPSSGQRSPLTVTARSSARPAQWGARGRWNRLSGGLLKLTANPQERAHRDALVTIRRGSWTRAVNVMVTNTKGGSGKTPSALLLAGILGHIRGGYVVVWEGSESKGTLARRAEGGQGRGMAELLAGVDEIDSAGNLGGYIAPQTSHADVIGSARRRAVLTAADVVKVRQKLDKFYRLTVTDTGNSLDHQAYQAALRTADAVVIPCRICIEDVDGLEDSLTYVEEADVATEESSSSPAAAPLAWRVVVLLTHDGGPEDPQVAEMVRERVAELGVAAVCEVPFDPAIRRGGEIALADLSEESTRAWTAAAAALVQALSTAPTDIDLVAELARELGDQAPTASAFLPALTS